MERSNDEKLMNEQNIVFYQSNLHEKVEIYVQESLSAVPSIQSKTIDVLFPSLFP